MAYKVRHPTPGWRSCFLQLSDGGLNEPRQRFAAQHTLLEQCQIHQILGQVFALAFVAEAEQFLRHERVVAVDDHVVGIREIAERAHTVHRLHFFHPAHEFGLGDQHRLVVG